MNAHRSLFSFLLMVLLLGSCGAESGGGCAPQWVSSGERLVGNPAPNFSLSSLTGEKIDLTNVVSQKPTLLVFWATWCPSCVEEIPLLNEWSQKYPQLQILGINVQEPAERVKPFAERQKIRYPVLLDPEAEVAGRYGLVGIPAAIVLAKGGRVVYYGFTLPKNIESLIQP